jgi:hypothetical protein
MMKKSCLLKTLFFSFVAAVLVMAGCSHPSGPAASQGPGTGQITVSIGVGGEENLSSLKARTLAPDFSTLPFDKFTLSFTATANGAAHSPVDITTGTTAVVNDLVAGTYTVSVTGYVGANEVAVGSAAGIVVTDGGNTPAAVTLGPKTGAGTGTFTYNITVPAGTGAATLIITTLEGAAVANGTVDLTTSPSGSISSLMPGYYTVQVVLTKDGKTAGLTEILHLYRGLTSSLTKAYGNSDFGVVEVVSATNLTALFPAPVTGGTPTPAFPATQYTGAIVWKAGGVAFTGIAFEAGTVYTAEVTLTAHPNYTFTGVAADAFTHGSKTGTNAADGNVVTIVFDATATTAPATGSVNVSIGFGLGAITVTGSDGINVIEQGNTLTLSVSGFESYTWKVDGGSAAIGTANSLALDTTGYAVQPHTLTFIGIRGGIPYAQLIPFTVTAAVGGSGTASTTAYVTYNSLAELKASLEAAPQNTTADPYKVKLGSELDFNDIYNNTDLFEPLYSNFDGKYVDLDLSGLDNSVTQLSNTTITDLPLPAHRNLLVKLTLPGFLTSVSFYAFRECANLVWVKVSDVGAVATLRLNGQSFQGCTSLEKVYLGTKMDSMTGTKIFSDCPALVTLVINTTTKLSVVQATVFSGTTQAASIMVYVPEGSVAAHSTTGTNTLINAGILAANIQSINNLASASLPENWQ